MRAEHLERELRHQANDWPVDPLSGEQLAAIVGRGQRDRSMRRATILGAIALPAIGLGAAALAWSWSPDQVGRGVPPASTVTPSAPDVDTQQIERATGACLDAPRSYVSFTRVAGAGGVADDPVAAAHRLLHETQTGRSSPVGGTLPNDVAVMVEVVKDRAVVASVRETGEVNAVLELERAPSDDQWFVDAVSGCGLPGADS